jgi:hypothetical protein
LNNNRNNNNRRRGRGNRQQGGNGQQLNRIDSRARGNAPQLLEKYRKLAHDAHLNGDRVQAEYYLQFADHYFRVLADQRMRQEEQRRPRDERYEGGNEGDRDEGGDDGSDFSNDSDFPSYDQAPAYNNRPPRQGQDERGREDREERGNYQQRRPEREERPERQERDERPVAEESVEADSGERNPFEPPENPFVRGSRGLRPRRDDRSRAPREERDTQGIDPGILPPPIALSPEDLMADDEPPAPKKPRGRPRKPKAEDGAGEALESVS